MHVPPLFEDLVLVLTASVPVVFVCQKIGLPALVGFIVTGVLIGPFSSGLIDSNENVEALAEIGVVLVLFTIGLEFSLARLAGMRAIVLGAGSLQVGAMIVVAAGAAMFAGYPFDAALVMGFIAALSSTAIVLKLLSDRAELGAPHGRFALGILLFQDLSVLPMLLLLPSLASGVGVEAFEVARTLGIAVAGAIVIVYAARTVLPAVFRQVLRLRSRELFLGVIVVTCFGTAWLTASLGISLAIGAFLAGLVVSESEYSHQVVADILPLRDLFSSVFFVSIGMLLDLGFVASHAVPVAILLAAIIFVKILLAAGSVMPFRPSSPRVALLVGAALAQVGEFSFVIAEEARRLDVLARSDFQGVLAAAVFSMILTPIVLRVTSAVADVPGLPGLDPRTGSERKLPQENHVVIVGYGFNGRNLVRVLRETGIRYCIVDLDSEAVRRAVAEGHPAVYGDATRPLVLAHVNTGRAAVIVVAINDAAATRRIVRLARVANRDAAIVVRTRYVAEIEELDRLGADEVIPEEMETSVELFARVLQRLDVPNNVIAAQVDVIRSEHYAMMREEGPSSSRIESIYELFAAATTVTHLIRTGSPAIGRTIADLGLRRDTGANLVALVRKGNAMTNPDDDAVLEKGDILVILGNHAEIVAARHILEPASE